MWVAGCKHKRAVHIGNIVHSIDAVGCVYRRDQMHQLNWDAVVGHAWSYTLLHIARTFILCYITPASLRDLPGTDAARAPPPATLGSSNVYSAAEATLLAWLEVHWRKMAPRAAKRLTNFTNDLTDCAALACVLASHWPVLDKVLPQLIDKPRSAEQKASNAQMLLSMLETLHCPFRLTESHLTYPDAPNMILFVAYLYSWLPQLVPRSTVDFAGRLQQEQVKGVELSNPSKKVLAYAARLHGHSDFSLVNQSLRIEPGSSGAVQVCSCRGGTCASLAAFFVCADKCHSGTKICSACNQGG